MRKQSRKIAVRFDDQAKWLDGLRRWLIENINFGRSYTVFAPKSAKCLELLSRCRESRDFYAVENALYEGHCILLDNNHLPSGL